MRPMFRLSNARWLMLSIGGMLPICGHAATWSVMTRGMDEPAIVFSAADIRAGRLPARLHQRNLAPVFSQQIVLACLAIPAQPDDLLVYLPASRQCMPYDDLPKATKSPVSALASPVETTTTAFGPDEPLEQATSLILQPASAVGIAAGLCFCPVIPPPNQAPVASVQSGSPQEATAGSAIATIVFHATDADDPSIGHSFSHDLDGGASVGGLPAGLSESCVAGSGTLNCEVTGTAPGQPGLYRITFVASDGEDSDSAIAQLTVIDAPQGEDIFKDGFEGAE